MTPLRFALIGAGNIGGTYAAALRKLGCAQLTAVVDARPESAAKLAAENGIEAHGTSLAAVAGRCEAVIVATPSGLHGACAVEAAGLGRHVLVEKPLEITAARMDEMTAACRRSGVALGVCFQRRTRALNRALKRLFDENAFGRVYGVEVSLRLYRPQAYYGSGGWRGTVKLDGGGPFMQQGAHDMDLLGWFFGKPATVFSRTGTFAHTGIEVEDHGAAILTWPDGAIGTVLASTAAKPGFDPQWAVFTERGTFMMANDVVTAWKVDGVPPPEPEPPFEGPRHSAAASAAVSDTRAHEAVITDFVEAVRAGRPPLVPPDQARVATEVILGIYESARARREVAL